MEKENFEILTIIKNNDVLKENDIILDIGCYNAGFIEMCVELFGPEINIIGFEPDPNNYKIATEKIKNYKNAKCINKAIFYSNENICKVCGVGDQNIAGYMVSLIDAEYANKIMYPHMHEYEGKIFELTQIEKYCANPFIVKLDCEASEWNILENSTAIQNTNHIVIEIHNKTAVYAKEFFKKYLPNHKIGYETDRHFYLHNTEIKV